MRFEISNVGIDFIFSICVNTKSFATAILVFFFFLSRPVFWKDCQKFFSSVLSFISWEICDQDWIYLIGHIKKVYVTNVFKRLFVMRVTHVTPCALLTVTSIHSIQKITKIRNSETRWKVTQKIQLFQDSTEKSS